MKRVYDILITFPFKQGFTKSLVIFAFAFLVVVNVTYFKGSLIKYTVTYLGFKRAKIVYGPMQNPLTKPTYSFYGVRKSFNGTVDMGTLSSMHTSLLKEMLLESIPRKIRKNAARNIDTIFQFSEKYNLDPIWVLSIVWVESHFKKDAKSYAGARGLMQIMPKTGVYLNKLLGTNLPEPIAYEATKDPVRNIELGSFYLNKLMSRFSGNYVYATVAYNMGPTYTARALRRKRYVGKRNLYLNKVKKVYELLAGPIIHYQKLQKLHLRHVASI